ncbi:hypothetical protein [Streptomyces sp. NPDC088739]|uniref:hypothetical protein n=1 Tax=Streptomyces sp. NPDC088739 TaxID=3365882 RepID=UPI003809AA9C
MAVIQPGAGASGTAVDRLAVTLRRISGRNDVLAASAVIYLEEEDGTTTELRPDPAPVPDEEGGPAGGEQ